MKNMENEHVFDSDLWPFVNEPPHELLDFNLSILVPDIQRSPLPIQKTQKADIVTVKPSHPRLKRKC